jgi:hypothetical protein
MRRRREQTNKQTFTPEQQPGTHASSASPAHAQRQQHRTVHHRSFRHRNFTTGTSVDGSGAAWQDLQRCLSCDSHWQCELSPSSIYRHPRCVTEYSNTMDGLPIHDSKTQICRQISNQQNGLQADTSAGNSAASTVAHESQHARVNHQGTPNMHHQESRSIHRGPEQDPPVPPTTYATASLCAARPRQAIRLMFVYAADSDNLSRDNLKQWTAC